MLATLDAASGNVTRHSTGFANHRQLAAVRDRDGATSSRPREWRGRAYRSHALTPLPRGAGKARAHCRAEVAVIAGSPAKPTAVLSVPLATPTDAAGVRTLRLARPATIEEGYISAPANIEFPTTHNRNAYGYFYRPRNRDFVGPGTMPHRARRGDRVGSLPNGIQAVSTPTRCPGRLPPARAPRPQPASAHPCWSRSTVDRLRRARPISTP